MRFLRYFLHSLPIFGIDLGDCDQLCRSYPPQSGATIGPTAGLNGVAAIKKVASVSRVVVLMIFILVIVKALAEIVAFYLRATLDPEYYSLSFMIDIRNLVIMFSSAILLTVWRRQKSHAQILLRDLITLHQEMDPLGSAKFLSKLGIIFLSLQVLMLVPLVVYFFAWALTIEDDLLFRVMIIFWPLKTVSLRLVRALMFIDSLILVIGECGSKIALASVIGMCYFVHGQTLKIINSSIELWLVQGSSSQSSSSIKPVPQASIQMMAAFLKRVDAHHARVESCFSLAAFVLFSSAFMSECLHLVVVMTLPPTFSINNPHLYLGLIATWIPLLIIYYSGSRIGSESQDMIWTLKYPSSRIHLI